ncbi:hypothetical protein MBLNU230_g7025t1 [Neophaeotheca triangularis]
MSSNISAARLSCQQCAQRKTRCDKNLPCSACRKAGLGCVAVNRQRLPRGKSGHAKRKDSLLKARIDRLEALVARIDAEGTLRTDADDHGKESKEAGPVDYPTIQSQPQIPTPRSSSTEPSPLNSYVASAFWQDLSTEVAGLRGVLEDPESEEISDHPERTGHDDSPPNDANLGTTRILFGTRPTAYTVRPANDMRRTLLAIFRDRVDSIFKVVHWPTICDMFGAETVSSLTPAQEALESCIYFTASCALTEDDFSEHYLLTSQYREVAEASLTKAGLLISQDLTVLQAFAIFIVGLRTVNTSAAPWVLVALLIRLAEAQGLSTKAPSARSPFEEEMRRRLWCSIGILDVQSAFDRGTKLLLAHDVDPAFPLNINDDEISPFSPDLPVSQPTLRCTDMILSCTTHRAMVCQRRLLRAGMQPEEANKTPAEIWKQKLSVIESFENYVNELTAVCSVSSTPFSRFTIMCGHGCLVTEKLLLRRPIQHQVHAKPSVDDDFDTLQVATEVLERSMITKFNAEFLQWAWFSWVKWYALAIVLAELCARPDAPGWERAWGVAKESFETYASGIADSDSGLLWRPVKRLMQKARERVGSLEAQMAAEEDEPLPGPLPGAMTGEAGFALNMANGVNMASMPSWDNVGEDGMSWFNWESFINDVSLQGEGWGGY